MNKKTPPPEAATRKRLLEEKVKAGYPNGWWYAREVRASANGWPQVYAESKYHCVYCRKDISTSADEIATSSTDHVVPQHLFPEVGGHVRGPNHLNNLVTACAACNSIKGGWSPDVSSEAWDTGSVLVSVSGGSETLAMGASQISNADFAAAIRQSIRELSDFGTTTLPVRGRLKPAS